MLRHAKQAFDDPAKPLALSAPAADWASGPIPRHFLNLARKYRPSPVRAVRINVVRERDLIANQRMQPAHPLQYTDAARLEDGGWDRWCKIQPRVHWVQGDHESILKPPLLGELAKTVRKAMDEHMRITC
jgi:thioesterase domain-containing protein